MKHRTLLPAALLAATLATPAHAACIQADLAGRWNAYTMAGSGQVTRCAVTVNRFGAVGATNCTFFDGTNSGTLVMSGGTMKLSDATRCAFQGSFVFNGVTSTMRELSLNKNGTVQGIGTSPGGTFMLSMTRY